MPNEILGDPYIQGLRQKTIDQEFNIKSLQSENESLKAKLERVAIYLTMIADKSNEFDTQTINEIIRETKGG